MLNRSKWKLLFSANAIILSMQCCLQFKNNQHNLKEYMSDSFTNYNYVENTKVSISIKKQMHIKREISNWNIKIILSVLIGAGNPSLRKGH